MICPKCGGYVQDGAIFCTSCGAPTSGSPQAPHQPPPLQQPYQQPYPQHYQQPYPPLHPPPPKKDPGLPVVLIIVVVIIVILVPVVLGALGWLFVPSQIPDAIDERVTLNLASPSVMKRDIGGDAYWDAAIEVNLLTPRDAVLSWASVMIVIKSSSDSVLLTASPVLADNPPSYDDASDGEVDVETWYVDLLTNFVFDPGDAFKITGMDTGYEGATVEITSFGERIGSITLPTDFP